MHQLLSLKNHFLIAMPTLLDANFSQTVTYICNHTAEGAMGIIINLPLSIPLGEVLANIGIDTTNKQVAQLPIFNGGPVHQDRGFVLHPYHKEKWTSSLVLQDNLCLTTSKDILEAIAHDEGPKEHLIILGHSGWGAGQLEKEIACNSWLSCPANHDILFHTACYEKWFAATKLLGINVIDLSRDVGHA